MMTIRSIFLATALLAATSTAALAQSRNDIIAAPVLRAQRHRHRRRGADRRRHRQCRHLGADSRSIARPDLGTTGSLPVTQVLSVLQAHQVIGVDTHDLREISVTRAGRGRWRARTSNFRSPGALEHRNGLGDAANLNLTFDRDVQDLRLDASNSGAMQAIAARFDPRSSRF